MAICDKCGGTNNKFLRLDKDNNPIYEPCDGCRDGKPIKGKQLKDENEKKSKPKIKQTNNLPDPELIVSIGSKEEFLVTLICPKTECGHGEDVLFNSPKMHTCKKCKTEFAWKADIKTKIIKW